MKKFAGLLSAILLLTMLSGCYKSETTFDFNVLGGVDVTSSLVASPALYEAAGLASVDDLVETFSEENISMYSQMYGMPETGERISFDRIDEQGNVLADGAEAKAEGMVGTKLKMHYDSLTDAANSFTLMNYLRTTPLTPSETDFGLHVTEKRTLLGTKYIASGKMILNGGAMYAAEWDAADEAAKAELASAVNSVTFRFPLAFSKSNADSKGFFGSSLTWTATIDAQEKDVYFEVTALNPLIVGMAVIILVLLVLLLVFTRKKNTPDAYFVDADGNPIPVFDSKEDALFEEDAAEEEADEELPVSDVVVEAETESGEEMIEIAEAVEEADAKPSESDTTETENE